MGGEEGQVWHKVKKSSKKGLRQIFFSGGPPKKHKRYISSILFKKPVVKILLYVLYRIKKNIVEFMEHGQVFPRKRFKLLLE